MKSKKGVLSELVQRIELLIAGILLLFLVGTLFVQYINQQSDTQKCQISIQLASKIETPISGSKVIDFDCPRTVLEIEQSDITVGRNQISPELLMNIFAQEVRRCNWMTGEGQLYPFQSNFWWTRDYVCLICREITFDDSLSQRSLGPFDLYSYMDINVMSSSQIYSNQNFTYLEYLKKNREVASYREGYIISTQNPRFADEYPRKLIANITTDDSYYIIQRSWRWKVVGETYTDQDEILVISKKDITRLGCLLAN